MAVPEHHIREAVARYVSGDITRREFQEWFVPRAWELMGGGQSPAVELASEIELLLAELSGGDWTESELRERLGEVVGVPPARLFHVDSPLAISVTGGGTPTSIGTPLQYTFVTHQTGAGVEPFWVNKQTPNEVMRAA